MKFRLVEVLPDKCRGCRLCEMACSFKHEEECSTTRSRIRIMKDNAWAIDFPVLCTQCADAPCLESCPAGALARDGTSGVVKVDEAGCVGCGECIVTCPLHALFLDGEKGVVFKCDLCGGDPECVKWCTNDALAFKETNLDAPERKAFMDRASEYLRVFTS